PSDSEIILALGTHRGFPNSNPLSPGSSPGVIVPIQRGFIMVSDRKLNANRNNAKKSTGPRTKEGKLASSQNATTHSLFCKHLVLPSENHQLFQVLRNSYIH